MKGTLLKIKDKWFVDDGFFMTYPLDPDYIIYLENDGDEVEFEVKPKRFGSSTIGEGITMNHAYIKKPE